MTKAGFCKLCNYFKEAKWNLPQFQKQVAEGKSLRALKMLLLGMGLEVSEKTISSHFKHMDSQIIEQRKHEASIKKKASKSFKKFTKFFIRPSELSLSKPCEHLKRRRQFDLETEKVLEFCIDCGELLASYDPIRGEKQDFHKNMRIYEALRRKRK